MQNITRKSIILTSRTQPYFSIKEDKLQYTNQDVVAQVLYFSVDPVMRVWINGAPTNFRKTQIGQIFNCFGLAKIIKGNSDYQTGSYFFGNTGTTNYVIIDQKRSRQIFQMPKDIVQMHGQQNFLYLINNGLAAYAGYQILSPKNNETVIVSTAAGATGLLLCQLLKKKGIRVIGLSSPHKLQLIEKYTSRSINYKDQQNLKKTLQQQNFSCYFDNVGDKMLDLVLRNIQKDGRIALCGAISNYDHYEDRGIANYGLLISKRIKMQGLTFFAMFPKMYDIFKDYIGIDLLVKLIKIQQFPSKFQQLLHSGNQIVGKIIVKL